MKLDAKVPAGELAEKWTKYRGSMNLVAPNNKRRLEVIVVGTGLAGASAAATLGELGYNVKCFTFHDSPRRAHSIACLLYTSPSPRDRQKSRMPSSA